MDNEQRPQQSTQPQQSPVGPPQNQPRSSKKSMIWAVVSLVVIALLIVAAIFYFSTMASSNNSSQQSQSTPPTDQNTSELPSSEAPQAENSTPPSNQNSDSTENAKTPKTPKTYTISYTNNCFDPANRAIKVGDTITFVNNSSRNMWPASNDHPSHTVYPQFDPKKSFAPGQSWSFTFTKAGAWGYHDHLKDVCDGVITVQ